MKVLFDNIFEDAVLSATNESLNYPVKNLTNPFLEKRFQSSTNSSVITCDFTEDQEFDCFFYGYHTAVDMTVIFKDHLGSILLTLVFNPEGNYIGVEEFPLITNVRTVDIYITGGVNVFLGGIGGGVGYVMPYMLSEYDKKPLDNSGEISSKYGQGLSNYIKPLHGYEFSFVINSKTISDEVYNKYRSVGIYKKMYFNMESVEESLYAKIISPVAPSRGKVTYKFKLNIQESR